MIFDEVKELSVLELNELVKAQIFKPTSEQTHSTQST